ncbi:nodal homolog 2-A-like [Gastrophryne carolinensis]
MAWLNFIFFFTIIFMAHGLPAFLQGNKNRIPLQQSNSGLRNSQNHKYSPFMMQLYQTLIMGNETDLSSLEYSILQDSDSVISLSAKGCTQMASNRELYFDMSSLSSGNKIQMAELRIHLSSTQNSQGAKLQIYHSKEGHKRLHLGTFHFGSSSTLGGSWKVFNLTKMLNSYLRLRLDPNFDSYTEDEDSRQKGHESSCTDISTDRVVLTVFTKDSQSANVHGYPNLIQTVKSSKYVMAPEVASEPSIKKQRKNRNAKHSIIMNNFPSKVIENGKPLCRRVDMIVDFEKLGWGEVVIYPKKFNAYRCEGACPIPLSETFKPTNHAYLTSLMKLYNSEKVECSSCVPVKTRPLSMLMYEDGDVVMKHHEDMIVEECGCH